MFGYHFACNQLLVLRPIASHRIPPYQPQGPFRRSIVFPSTLSTHRATHPASAPRCWIIATTTTTAGAVATRNRPKRGTGNSWGSFHNLNRTYHVCVYKYDMATYTNHTAPCECPTAPSLDKRIPPPAYTKSPQVMCQQTTRQQTEPQT